MELSSYFKTNDVLPNSSLESLHAESVAWLSELEFWNEELAFLVRLLAHSEFSRPFPRQDVAEMEKELVTLMADKVEKVSVKLSGHERLLSDLFRRESLPDELSYREQHRDLLRDIGNLFEEIRKFKRSLFSFVEKHRER